MTGAQPLGAAIGTRATLGLVVLQVDETIEHEMQRMCHAPDIALHVSRIPSGDTLTPETIAQMDAALAGAAALLPPAAEFHCVAYACTSGTAHLGAGRVASRLRGQTGAASATDPLTATLAALRALGARRIGLVSPYIESVGRPIVTALEEAGVSVASALSFGERTEAKVARIDRDTLFHAAKEVGAHRGLDAVFLSCTNLRTLDVIEEIEATLGIPVVTSNQALAWHMLRLCGLDSPPGQAAPGRLLHTFPALPGI